MRLTTAKAPYKTKAPRTVVKVLKPATYKDGIPIDAVRKTEEVEVDIWVVETSYNGLTEKHEFADEAGALNYYRGFQ